MKLNLLIKKKIIKLILYNNYFLKFYNNFLLMIYINAYFIMKFLFIY